MYIRQFLGGLMRVLLLLVIGIAVFNSKALAAQPMPPAVVLIVCKSVAVPFVNDRDAHNAKYTGHESRQWAIEGSMMQCRRKEVQLFDQSEAMGAAAQPFNQQRCQRAGLLEGIKWDAQHSTYKFWRVACPVPIVDASTGEVIAWQMPGCGHRDTVVCEVDTAI